MADDIWQGGSADWTTLGAWSLGLPDATSDAIIQTPDAVSIQFGENAVANSLAIDNAGASLTVNGSLNVTDGVTVGGALSVAGGTLNLGTSTLNLDDAATGGHGVMTLTFGASGHSGTVSGGTIHPGGGTVNFNNAILDSVRYEGSLNVVASGGEGGTLTIANSITLTDANGVGPGEIGMGGLGATLQFSGNPTIDNATINLNGFITTPYQTPGDVTFGQHLIIQQAGPEASVSGFDTTTNLGTIHAGTSGGSFDISGNFANEGVIIADNGDKLNINQYGSHVNNGITTETTVNDGTVNVKDGASLVIGSVTGTGTVSLDSGGVAYFRNDVAAGQTVSFHGGTLRLEKPSTFEGTLSGFGATDKVVVYGEAVNNVAWDQTHSTFNLFHDATQLGSLNVTGDYTGVTFEATVSSQGNSVIQETPCFARGTRLLTARGEVAVEDLVKGDLAATASGTLRPVKWVGSKRVVIGPESSKRNLQPVRIMAGALGHGVPFRDLYVSPGHAINTGGVLIPAIFLVNGRTILRCEEVEQVDYFHVELDRHDIVLAEGAPAESYLDDGNRGLFDEAIGLLPRCRVVPTVKPVSCAPVSTEGTPLEAARLWTGKRAEIGGYTTTSDPDLHLLADGRRIEPAAVDGKTYIFYLDRPAKELRIASRSSVPEELEGSTDPRRLGVAVAGITLSAKSRTLELLADDELLSDGFHDLQEPYRWTDGDAAIPAALLALFRGPLVVDVRLEHLRSYAVRTEAEEIPMPLQAPQEREIGLAQAA